MLACRIRLSPNLKPHVKLFPLPRSKIALASTIARVKMFIDYCTQHNIAFIPYGSLAAHPLKRGAPLANAERVLAEIGDRYNVKPNQIALAWLLHRAPNIVLIPGTTTIDHLEKNVAATSIQLTTNELVTLSQS